MSLLFIIIIIILSPPFPRGTGWVGRERTGRGVGCATPAAAAGAGNKGKKEKKKEKKNKNIAKIISSLGSHGLQENLVAFKPLHSNT